MVITFLQRLLWLVALVAAQMMVFNYVHILGYATPMPYVYLLLLFPLGTQRWTILLWGFCCGLLCDIVSLTTGVGAGAMTVAAFIQPPLLTLLAPKDAVEDMQPSFAAMDFWPYVRYAAVVTFVFTAVYFLLQSFNFFHIVDLAISFLSSWLLTLLICVAIEGVRGGRSSKNIKM
ncbi:MAG: rod shape-determining protein MreD [Bacteroidaceae bacterium]|nr:rod shape-determining protein MreD [Bacteroidaceae bacterium]